MTDDPKPDQPAPDAGGPSLASVTEMPSRRARVTEETLLWSRQHPPRASNGAHPRDNPFKLPSFPPGVGPPKDQPNLAMDSSYNSMSGWAGDGAQYAAETMNDAYAEGMVFPGYSVLATLAQRAEFRVITETIASEMTREWIELKSVSQDESKTDKLKDLMDAIDRFKLQDVFRRAAESDGFFGRGHIFIDTGDTDDRDELTTSLGNGRDEVSRYKIKDNSIKSFRSVEAVWCYPTHYESVDPLKSGWYDPYQWYVMSKAVHKTRLMTFIGREVPDILKPAYAFGGLSMSQMVKPYVDNWIETRRSVADLVRAFSVFVLHTNMDAVTGIGGEDLFRRVQVFNNFKDNQGCVPGETLITTERGDVPIRDVTTADRVMTRNGWAPLAWSGVTGYTGELVEITTSSGACLRATGDHPIYLPGIDGFVNASTVKVGDRLVEDATKTTDTVTQSSIVAIGGHVTRWATTAISRLAAYCTEFFGRIMSGQYPMGMSSIMAATETAANSPIWNSSHLVNTPFTIWPENHVPASPGMTILNTGRSKLSAANAARSLRGLVRPIHGSIAATNASTDSTIVANTRGVKVAKQPVYNLEVAEGYLPEYFANGVLVHNCLVIDKNNEEFSNVSVPISGLDALQAQAQEQMASISRIPIVKLLGIQPAGLNASSEGELISFYDWIHSFQETLFREHLTTCIDFIQLSEYGEIDDDITFDFKSLRQLDEGQKAGIQSQTSQTHSTYVELGAVTAEEVREALGLDPDSPYAGLDLSEALPTPMGMPGMPPMPGMGMPGMPGGPSGAPPGPPQGPPEAGPAPGGPQPPPQTDMLSSPETKGWKSPSWSRPRHNAQDDAEDEGELGLDISFGYDAKFDESKIHRDKGGEFASTGSSGGGSAKKGPPPPVGPAPEFKPTKKTGHLQPAPEDRKQLPAFLKNAKIPPAWRNLHVSPSSQEDMWASGFDRKNNQVYIFNPKFKAKKEANKFKRVEKLSRKIDGIIAQNERYMKSKNPATREAAAAQNLIMKMGLRPGSTRDTHAEQQAYGATTLKGEHVVTDPDGKTHLQFVGKKGVSLDLPVDDEELAQDLRDRAKDAGPNGDLFNVNYSHLSSYVKTLGGGSFLVKDFRTHLGTTNAQRMVSNEQHVPSNAKEYKKMVTDIATKVSHMLGNTPSIALKSYIAPQVFSQWKAAAGVA